MAKKPQDSLHIILKPIRYHGEGEHHRKRIAPKDGILLPFSHLTDGGYALLTKKRVLAPASAAEVKKIEEANKAYAAALKADLAKTEKEAQETIAVQKAAAMAKQLKQDGE